MVSNVNMHPYSKARDEARKKWELDNAPEPFDAEVTAAEQLITYLSKWGDAEVADTEAAAKAAEAEAEKAKKLEVRRTHGGSLTVFM